MDGHHVRKFLLAVHGGGHGGHQPRALGSRGQLFHGIKRMINLLIHISASFIQGQYARFFMEKERVIFCIWALMPLDRNGKISHIVGSKFPL